MDRLLVVGVLCAVVVAGCGRTAEVDRVCEFNDEFAALNERTLPNIEDDPYPEPAMLEENFIEGNKLMRRMVEVAPDDVREDLITYVESMEKLSDLYADFGYNRAELWKSIERGLPIDEETYVREYSFDEVVRARIGKWFTEHCGMDLQG